MIILTGKTCSGKDTIKKELVKLGMTPITTYTTRPIRDGEIDGEAYYFIDELDFAVKVNDGFFAEATYYKVANGDTWFYGSAKDDYVKNGVMILNPVGIKDLIYIQKLNPFIVYIKASNETIETRLTNRGDDAKEAKRRLLADTIDFMNMDKMCDIAISNNGEYEPIEIAREIRAVYEVLKEN